MCEQNTNMFHAPMGTWDDFLTSLGIQSFKALTVLSNLAKN